jgi:hypothetical protein
MANEIPLKIETGPRPLNKPARNDQEMDREELVTYTDESGGGKPPGDKSVDP